MDASINTFSECHNLLHKYLLSIKASLATLKIVVYFPLGFSFYNTFIIFIIIIIIIDECITHTYDMAGRHGRTHRHTHKHTHAHTHAQTEGDSDRDSNIDSVN